MEKMDGEATVVVRLREIIDLALPIIGSVAVFFEIIDEVVKEKRQRGTIGVKLFFRRRPSPAAERAKDARQVGRPIIIMLEPSDILARECGRIGQVELEHGPSGEVPIGAEEGGGGPEGGAGEVKDMGQSGQLVCVF